MRILALDLGTKAGWAARVDGLTHSGVIDLRPIVFYLSLTALFLFLTLKSVESRRWK